MIVSALIGLRTYFSAPPASTDTAKQWWLDWMLPWLWPLTLLVVAIVTVTTTAPPFVEHRRRSSRP